MKKTNEKFPYSINLSKNTELSKGLLLFTCGYIFCFMFLLDYSQEGMSIFYRWSTVSLAQFRHPVLFALWVSLCAFTFLLNLDYLRRRHNVRHKTVAILQYTGFVAAYTMLFIPTHLAPHETFLHHFQYYGHRIAAIVYALANMFCLFAVVIIKRKEDKRFNFWFYLCLFGILAVVVFFAIHLCGFIETAPTLMIFAGLYVLNFTKAVEPLPDKSK